jgi:hypothetical protein
MKNLDTIFEELSKSIQDDIDREILRVLKAAYRLEKRKLKNLGIPPKHLDDAMTICNL